MDCFVQFLREVKKWHLQLVILYVRAGPSKCCTVSPSPRVLSALQYLPQLGFMLSSPEKWSVYAAAATALSSCLCKTIFIASVTTYSCCVSSCSFYCCCCVLLQLSPLLQFTAVPAGSVEAVVAGTDATAVVVLLLPLVLVLLLLKGGDGKEAMAVGASEEAVAVGGVGGGERLWQREGARRLGIGGW